MEKIIKTKEKKMMMEGRNKEEKEEKKEERTQSREKKERKMRNMERKRIKAKKNRLGDKHKNCFIICICSFLLPDSEQLENER